MTDNNLLDELTQSMIMSYQTDTSIFQSHLKLPNHSQIILILEQLQELIFPNYYTQMPIEETSWYEDIRNMIHRLKKRLCSQLTLAFENQEITVKNQEKNSYYWDKSCQICDSFLTTIPTIRHALSGDVQAAFDGDPAANSLDEIILSYPGIYAILVYRIAHELYCLEVPLIPRIMSEHAHSVTGIDIHPGATIGENFFIDHGTGVVIGETTVIKNNVKIYQGVTLGALSLKGGHKLQNIKRHPTIEDNVVIYSGASILGGKTIIGKNVIIGGNSFITSSIPDETKVRIKDPEHIFKK